MKKAERIDDIQNRFFLALAERNFTERGSENYNILSEVANLILTEYQNKGHGRNRNRHGFRLYNGKYHIVVLNPDEKI